MRAFGTLCYQLVLCFLAFPGTVWAQEGLALDPFLPALGMEDLTACRGLAIARGRLSLAVAGGWNWHILRGPDELKRGWLAEQNLDAAVGLELDLNNRLRLGFSTFGALWQQGERIDAWGGRESLSSGWGESWLWAVLQLVRSRNWQLGIDAGMRLASASPEALTGEASWGSRMGLLGQVNVAPWKILINALLVERRRTIFYQLERASVLQLAEGVELAPARWPAGFFLEFWSEANPQYFGKTALVQILGSAFVKLDRWRLIVGTGGRLYGEGMARLRAFLGLRTSLDFSRWISE